MEDAQTWEINLQYIAKAHQSILKNPRAKSTGKFEKNTRIPLKIPFEKVSFGQKRNKFEYFLKILVHADSATKKRGTFY